MDRKKISIPVRHLQPGDEFLGRTESWKFYRWVHAGDYADAEVQQIGDGTDGSIVRKKWLPGAMISVFRQQPCPESEDRCDEMAAMIRRLQEMLTRLGAR